MLLIGPFLFSDVTDEKAPRLVHETSIQTMPPIEGVINGAMVLRDSSIKTMQYDQVMDVIRPKAIPVKLTPQMRLGQSSNKRTQALV